MFLPIFLGGVAGAGVAPLIPGYGYGGYYGRPRPRPHQGPHQYYHHGGMPYHHGGQHWGHHPYHGGQMRGYY